MVVSSIPGRHTIGRLVMGLVTVFGQAYHLGMLKLKLQTNLYSAIKSGDSEARNQPSRPTLASGLPTACTVSSELLGF